MVISLSGGKPKTARMVRMVPEGQSLGMGSSPLGLHINPVQRVKIGLM